MAELVGEDAQAAVLRLDGVVTDPDAGGVVRDRVGRVRALAEAAAVGADVHTGQATGAAGLEVGVPAVAPDGVGAVGRVTGRLVAARVDDLEVVDEAVGLVEVAVPVDVVAVLLVEGPQVRLDLRHLLARLQLLVHPDGQRVAHQRLGRGAGGHRRSHRVAAVTAAVEGLVVGHLHPLGDVTVDRVAAGGLALVVGRHPVEVHVLVVGPVVVRLPQRGVVRAPVGLGDLVVQRTVEGGRLGVGEVVRRGVGEAAGTAGAAPGPLVALVSELGEHDEDPVGALTLELDLLALAPSRERVLALRACAAGRPAAARRASP